MPSTPTVWDMVVAGTPSSQVILAVLGIFSLASWALLFGKVWQFRRARRHAAEAFAVLETAPRLEEAYRRVLALPDSPWTRLFRRGLNFFSELRPGALRDGDAVEGLSPAQLEVLRLMLEKEEGEERDALARGLPWLAVFATVAPLLGLLGTVLGVMNAFLGVARAGSTSIAAVAPGIAEALLTTAAGLVVAIPSAMGYHYLQSRLQLLVGDLEGFASEFIGALAREGKV